MYLSSPFRVIRTTPPASEPVSLQEAKLFLRIDHDTEDTAISQMIKAAREVAEEIMNSSLITQRWQLTLQDALPACFTIPYGPVTQIISVSRVNADGSTSELNSNIITIGADAETLECAAPQTATQFTIVYEAGMSANAAGVPASLRQNMLQHIAYLYGFRTLGDAERIHDITKLYAPWRKISV